MLKPVEVYLPMRRSTFLLSALVTVFVILSACSNPSPQAPASQPAPAAKPPIPQTSPMSGAEMYTTYCASCHGADGKGNGPAAPALKKRLPDLTVLAKRKKGKFPEGDVFQVIKWGGGIVGHGSKEMPVWGSAFKPVSHQDEKEVDLRIKSLIQYLESLQQK